MGYDRAASVGGEGGLVSSESIGFPFRRAPRFWLARSRLSVEIKGRSNKGLQRTRVSMPLMQGLKVAAFVRAAEAQRYASLSCERLN